MQSKVCVLGAGRMGSSIVRSLVSHGYETWVWNRTAAKSEPLVALGGKATASVEEGIRAADVVIVNVLDYAASAALLKRESIASILAGKVIVQLTSGSPRLAREEARWAEAHGAHYLDGAMMATPDFIGRPEAALLYSGPQEVFEAHKDLLFTLGGGTSHVGDIPGQASALDTAQLTQMWGALFGALQGMAVIEAEDLGLETFQKQLLAFKPVVDAALPDLIERTRTSRFAGDETTLASLGAHYSAFQHLLEACEERGSTPPCPGSWTRSSVRRCRREGRRVISHRSRRCFEGGALQLRSWNRPMASIGKTRTAACSCRNVEIALAGEPRRVYACSCVECQRCTGSAFSYRAIYPDSAVLSRKGETRSWRRSGSSGQWLEQHFCTTCGSVVFMRAETLKDALSVSAGCLEDPEFPPPLMLHWPDRKHRWLCLEGVPEAGSS